MPQSCFNETKIAGIVTCVPPLEKCIDDEVELFGGNVKQIERLKKTIGLNKRRVVDAQTTALDLCESAASQLLADRGIDASSIDALVCVTQTPDHLQPCNAAILHGRLGLSTTCAAFDVGLGCSGYVYGLWLGHLMIQAGGCQRVLVLAGDTLSRLVHPKDRAVAPLFGDGGSATLLERSDVERMAWFCLGSDGTGASHLIVPAGGARQPISDATKVEREDDAGNLRSDETLFMDGAEVFNFSIQVVPDSVRATLEYAGLEADSVDYFVFHQANRYILGNITKRLRIDPEKVPMHTVERYGNQSSASIPCAICNELSASLAGAERSRLLLSGFGVGLSWGSALVELGPLAICKVIEYKPA